VDRRAVIEAVCYAGDPGLIPSLVQTYYKCRKAGSFLKPCVQRQVASTVIAQLSILKNALAKAKVFPHLEACVRLGYGTPHVQGQNSVRRLYYPKE
jgi:hypothetical protein